MAEFSAHERLFRVAGLAQKCTWCLWWNPKLLVGGGAPMSVSFLLHPVPQATPGQHRLPLKPFPMMVGPRGLMGACLPVSIPLADKGPTPSLTESDLAWLVPPAHHCSVIAISPRH